MFRRSLATQCAIHLTDEIKRGRWSNRLPGVDRLAVDLKLSRETVREALRMLERDGILTSAGAGRHRRIVPDQLKAPSSGLRIAMLLHDPFLQDTGSGQTLILQIRQALQQAGHICEFCPKSQSELGMNLKRIAREVAATEVDAWLVFSGSVELLEWFAKHPQPVLAVGGRAADVAIASVVRNATDVMRGVFRDLIGLGHRRIVMICPHERRGPHPAPSLRLLEEELAAGGHPCGPYHFPDWEESPKGLQVLLESLFRLTPPTALHVVFPEWAVGVLAFLTRRGLRVPDDVSLVCENMDNTLVWHEPRIAHFRFDEQPVLRRIVHWAQEHAAGREDRRMVTLSTEFDPGQSIQVPPAR